MQPYSSLSGRHGRHANAYVVAGNDQGGSYSVRDATAELAQVAAGCKVPDVATVAASRNHSQAIRLSHVVKEYASPFGHLPIVTMMSSTCC